jgi:hypothetical protein
VADTIRGACLCGTIRYEIENRFNRFFLCHCKQCQKISGSDHTSNLFAETDRLTWLTGEDQITRFNYHGRGFTNAFCKLCGSGVPYLNQSGTAIVVRAGSLDGEPLFENASKIFVSERAQWSEKSTGAVGYEKFPT